MKSNKLFLFFMVEMFFTACDRKAEVTVVKNNLFETVIVVPWNDQEFGIITDSMIYNDRIYMPDVINSHDIGTMVLPVTNFSNAPDSVKVELYVIKSDSLDYYKKKGIEKGILRHSLKEKIVIQVNKIKTPIDTVNLD